MFDDRIRRSLRRTSDDSMMGFFDDMCLFPWLKATTPRAMALAAPNRIAASELILFSKCVCFF